MSWTQTKFKSELSSPVLVYRYLVNAFKGIILEKYESFEYLEMALLVGRCHQGNFHEKGKASEIFEMPGIY